MDLKNLTQEEKINYIFETLQKQEKRDFRRTLIKTIFRIFIILYFIYFYFFWFAKLLDFVNKEIKDNLKIDINSQEIINNIKENFKK